MINKDLAGKHHWDSIWDKLQVSTLPYDSTRPRYKNFLYNDYDIFFSQLFSQTPTDGKMLLEVGCGGSVWLPYFAKKFGMIVHGLDYSEKGVCLSRTILSESGVSGSVVCSDMFNPPEFMMGCYDIVVSFGVIEHFSNTQQTLIALTRFLNNEGILITVIPNLLGISGLTNRLLNPDNFTKHLRLSLGELEMVYRKLGLSVCEESGYLFPYPTVGICVEGLPSSSLRYVFSKSIKRALAAVGWCLWVLQPAFGTLPCNRYTALSICCVGKVSSRNTPLACHHISPSPVTEATI